MHNRIIMLVLLVFFTMILSEVYAEEVIEGIVAKVDRYIITQSELNEALQPSIDQITSSFPPDEWDRRIREVRSRILNRMINEYVAVRFARDNDVKVSDAEIEGTIMDMRKSAGIESDEVFKQQLAMEGITLEDLKEILRRQSLLRRVLRGEVYSKVRVTESEIREFYEDNIDEFKGKDRVRAAVLIVNTESEGIFSQAAAEEKIHSLFKKLKEGADFAELVQEHSDGPARNSGGDIGFLERGRVQPAIESVAFELSAGEFSKPVQTDFGWVIVKAVEREDGGIRSFDEVRDELEMRVQESKSLQAEQEWFDVQRAKTFIEIKEF
jgi:peptidyl-prolyl cis-trans isomerase SurA